MVINVTSNCSRCGKDIALDEVHIVRAGGDDVFFKTNFSLCPYPDDSISRLRCFFAEGDLQSIAKKVAREGMVILEVGAWVGSSTAALAKVASENKGKVFTVDHWKGSSNLIEYGKSLDVFSIFRQEMEKLGYWLTVVFPLFMSSEIAGSIFQDGIIDLVYIDGDHAYSGIMHDLKCWYSKLKIGGIICGHDCDVRYSSCSKVAQEMINKKCELDFADGIHCGVTKALYDFFQDKYNLTSNSIFCHVKEK